MKKLILRLVIVAAFVAIAIVIVVSLMNKKQQSEGPYLALQTFEESDGFITFNDRVNQIANQDVDNFASDNELSDITAFTATYAAIYDIYSYYVEYSQFADSVDSSDFNAVNDKIEDLKKVTYINDSSASALAEVYLTQRDIANEATLKDIYSAFLSSYLQQIKSFYDLAVEVKSFTIDYVFDGHDLINTKTAVLNIENILVELIIEVRLEQISVLASVDYRRFDNLITYLNKFVDAEISATKELQIKTTEFTSGVLLLSSVNSTLTAQYTLLDNFYNKFELIDKPDYYENLTDNTTYQNYYTLLSS
ncbi:MAG: hypothetical protein WC942_02585 [Clostridia bacterium]|jgi:hypothetical protein